MGTHIVCYHEACVDGFVAGYSAVSQLRHWGYDIKAFPVNYKQDILGKIKDVEKEVGTIEHIVFVDFCPTNEQLLQLLSMWKVAVIDHHKTAVQNITKIMFPEAGKVDARLVDNLRFVFAKDQSGASLTELIDLPRFLDQTEDAVANHGEVIGDIFAKPLPCLSGAELSDLFKLVRIRDLWINPGSFEKRQADALSSYFSVEGLFNLNEELNNGELDLYQYDGAVLESAISDGKAFEKQMLLMCENALKSSFTTKIVKDGVTINVAIGSILTGMGSKFGEMFVDRYPDQPAIAIGVNWNLKKGGVGLNLRSNKFLSARKVAELFGGGGHEHASGAVIDTKDFSLPLTAENLIDTIVKHIEVGSDILINSN